MPIHGQLPHHACPYKNRHRNRALIHVQDLRIAQRVGQIQADQGR